LLLSGSIASLELTASPDSVQSVRSLNDAFGRFSMKWNRYTLRTDLAGPMAQYTPVRNFHNSLGVRRDRDEGSRGGVGHPYEKRPENFPAFAARSVMLKQSTSILLAGLMATNAYSAKPKPEGVAFPMKYEGGSLNLDHSRLTVTISKTQILLTQGKANPLRAGPKRH
jgi:hypothetical protein